MFSMLHELLAHCELCVCYRITTSESMCCGRPVISFDLIRGSLETVRSRRWLM